MDVTDYKFTTEYYDIVLIPIWSGFKMLQKIQELINLLRYLIKKIYHSSAFLKLIGTMHRNLAFIIIEEETLSNFKEYLLYVHTVVEATVFQF